MSAEDRPNREVAHRVFAAEFDDADLTVSAGDEERSPNYVVTPTGARANRVFVVGVLTTLETVGDGVLRARIADPTGAFVVYAGQYQPDALASLESLEPPAFVAVTGKARTFEPDDADRVYSSVRPESVNAVDAETRDRWIVSTAERTLERVAQFAGALDRPERGEDLAASLRGAGLDESFAEGIATAVDHYGTTPAYLAAVREMALDATRVVADELESVPPLDVDPADEGAVDVDLTEAPAVDVAVATVPTGPAQSGGGSADSTATESADAAPTDADATDAADEPADETDAAADEPADETDAAAETAVAGADETSPSATEADEEPATAETGADDGADAAGGAAEESGEMYEFDEEEREAVREEYGVEFSSGDEIPDAGESDIDAPDVSEEEADDDANEADDDADEAADDDADEDDEATAPEDLEDVVVDYMGAIGDGGPVARDELIEAVQEDHDVDASDVEDAIQDALMAGRCYESGDDELTPI